MLRDWIVARYNAIADWIALRASELWGWIRATWRKFTLWLSLALWDALGPLLDLLGRKHG